MVAPNIRRDITRGAVTGLRTGNLQARDAGSGERMAGLPTGRNLIRLT
jgi:hypothetical protein